MPLLRAFAIACLLVTAAFGPCAAAVAMPDENVPGRMQPAAPATPAAYRFHWDDYDSLVVVSEDAVAGQPLRRPAWVVTYDQAGAFVVGYRATAFRDAAGILHIDARKAAISGPQRDGWSPDSFAISSDGQVLSIDDRNSANTGRLTETTEATAGEPYRTLLRIAIAIVHEMS